MLTPRQQGNKADITKLTELARISAVDTEWHHGHKVHSGRSRLLANMLLAINRSLAKTLRLYLSGLVSQSNLKPNLLSKLELITNQVLTKIVKLYVSVVVLLVVNCGIRLMVKSNLWSILWSNSWSI